MAIEWQSGMAFSAMGDSGRRFEFDALSENGGEGRGPTPTEAFVASVAACSAMDVLGVLRQEGQQVTRYRVEVNYERAGDGARPITAVTIRHLLGGEGLDEAAVARAIQWSDGKYCTMIATLRTPVDVQSVWTVE